MSNKEPEEPTQRDVAIVVAAVTLWPLAILIGLGYIIGFQIPRALRFVGRGFRDLYGEVRDVLPERKPKPKLPKATAKRAA